MVRLRLTTKERLERSQSIQHEDEASIFFSSLEDDVQNLKLMIHQLDAASLRRSADMSDSVQRKLRWFARGVLLPLEYSLSFI